ncbi:MAG TPA: polyprenyl synthetase family protein [Solirubrobacteraceae bacterium]|jgi:heptaprenyl diphosphate synthase
MNQAVGRQPTINGSPYEICLVSREEIVLAANAGELASELSEPVGYVLATTGKRLRSAIVLSSAHAGPDPHHQDVRTGAIAIELGHLATLAHDDILDDGTVRRGTDTVGVAYGSLASGYVGGALVVRASELMATFGEEPMRVFARTAAEMCSGQMAEFEDSFDTTRSVERYYLAIAGKTASLFEVAAWLGGWLAGAPTATVNSLARFGREFGMAFQIADDILDVLAPISETGKLQAKDLLQGVYSLPVIYALQTDRELGAALEQPLTQADLPKLVARIRASGGVVLASHECFRRARRAQSIVHEELEPAVATSLAALVEQSIAPITRRMKPKHADAA